MAKLAANGKSWRLASDFYGAYHARQNAVDPLFRLSSPQFINNLTQEQYAQNKVR